MTREEFKQKVSKKSKSDESMYPNYIHLLSLYPFIEQLFDEHEAQLKLASDVYSTDKMHMYQELKAKDKITQDIKEAYELKSIAYDLLLEVIKLKDEEIDRLKASVKQWRQNFLDA